jgi:septal ring factor EnvC (AmiA/AmiB activator)
MTTNISSRRTTPLRPWCRLTLALVLLCGELAVAATDPLTRSIDTSKENTRQEAKTQQRIDQLDDQTKAMLEEYQRLSRELDVLKVYDDQLQRLVESQEAEKVSIRQQMQGLELTQREIVPLMLRMVAWLEEFLRVDQPFLPEERNLRIEQLKQLMDRADVSVGEKYRRVLEAYQIEMDYSRTIEASRGELLSGDKSRSVDFLRIGRVGLYYLTLDREEVGFWNPASGQWETLPERYNLAIRNGLRIARKQAAPDLLRLPVNAPWEVKP